MSLPNLTPVKLTTHSRAQKYVVNKKSALDWLVERACVSIDKASGIVNDFNDYATEIGNDRYLLELFLKVIMISLEL